MTKGHPAPQWKMYWDGLSTEPEMPGLILYQHCGETKTLQLARSLYFLPGMTRAIKNKVSHCSECLELRPSRPSEPFIQTLNVSRPFEAISIDLGYLKGDHYLVMVDRYSGWPKVQKMTKLDTKAVTEVLKTWFMQHGIPNRIRSDFGPQFHGEFQSWSQGMDIVHKQTSPYNPQANGHAEEAIGEMKCLITKAGSNDFKSAMLGYRNTPRIDGLSPVQWYLGRRQ